MYIKEINRTWNKGFTNLSCSSPLLYRRCVKVLLEVGSNKLFFIFRGRPFNTFANSFQPRSRKIRNGLKCRDKRKGSFRNPRLLGGDWKRWNEVPMFE